MITPNVIWKGIGNEKETLDNDVLWEWQSFRANKETSDGWALKLIAILKIIEIVR